MRSRNSRSSAATSISIDGRRRLAGERMNRGAGHKRAEYVISVVLALRASPSGGIRRPGSGGSASRTGWAGCRALPCLSRIPDPAMRTSPRVSSHSDCRPGALRLRYSRVARLCGCCRRIAPSMTTTRLEQPTIPALDSPALYINRELSWLAFNERVLAQARDAPAPAARARQVPRDRRHQPRRVLHDSRRGAAQAAAHRPAIGCLARRPDHRAAGGAGPRAGAGDARRAGAVLDRRRCGPASQRHGIRFLEPRRLLAADRRLPRRPISSARSRRC